MKNIEILKRKIAKGARRFVRKFKTQRQTKHFRMTGKGTYRFDGTNQRYTRFVPPQEFRPITGKTGDYRY